MPRKTFIVVCFAVATAASSGVGHAQTWMEEFQWNQLNPVGVQDWTSTSNWSPPAAPPGNPSYPDDPNHVDTDPDTLASVVGANLAAALTADLDVRLNSDITIASLVLGVDNRATTISGPGLLLFSHDEDNVIVVLPRGPDDTVDEYTCAFNCGNSLVTSGGNASSSNVISAVVGSTQSVDFNGPQTLTLAGGFEEVAVDVENADGSVANNTNLRSYIGRYDSSTLVENQTRLVITGTVTTVVDELTDPFDESVDRPLLLGGGGDGIPELRSAENSQLGNGYPSGIIDLSGGITGDGKVRIGSQSGAISVLPLATVALYDNSYAGSTKLDRANVVLKHNNAFSTGTVRNGNPANQVGFNMIVEPGPGETPATVNRVLANNFAVPHDFTVKGQHSLTITGEYEVTNSAGWVNILPAGETFTLTGQTYTEEDNILTYDGSGETRVRGQLRNTDADVTDSGFLSTNNSGVMRKRGTGAVYIESSQFGHLNTFKADSDDNLATILVEGGNLHFATAADMGGHDSSGVQQFNRMGDVQSKGGAVGLDDGTIIGPGRETLMGKLNNLNQRSIPFEGDVESFGDWDHGGLMLAIPDAGATLNFGDGGDLENAQDMSVAAPGTGLTFTGTINPANNTYRLGGGSGTISIAGDNKLTGARDLVVTNGGDFKNPNGEDRVRLGMVRLDGTHSYSGVTTIIGKYQRTLQDQARRDAVGVGIENRVGTAEIQYNGTTLAVSSLGDDASSIGTSTSAASLLIQGSTLRYEGAGETTNRVFTMGTAGATIDASGTGPIDFGSPSPIVMDTAEPRSGGYDGIGFNGSESVIYDLGNTDDVLIGMPISDSDGGIPGGTVVAEILSLTRVRISNNISQFAFADNVTVTFGNLDRTLTLTGSNMSDNNFASLISDAPDGGIVGLTKTDVGKWIVDGANAYSGPTHLQAGTLIVNGIQTGSGDTTVDLAATLGGGGVIGGDLLADGVVAPADGIGRLTVMGDADFSESSLLDIELGGLLAGDQYDVLDVGGALTIDDATLSIVLSGFDPVAGNSFDILDFDSASGMFGDFVLPAITPTGILHNCWWTVRFAF